MVENRQPTADELNGVKQDTVHWPAKAHRVTQVDSEGNENERTKPLYVFNVDDTRETVNLYLYNCINEINLTLNTSIDDKTINVEDTIGVVLGDAITFYEGDRFFQSIIKSITTTSITFASPLDFAYTTSAIIESGCWNMNLDGSETTQKFHIRAPPLNGFMIHTVAISITSSTPMDSAKFGGIPQLPNGLLFRGQNGYVKNYPLIVNNLGLSEIGFDVEYDSKAPAGVYGLRAQANIQTKNGVTIQINGETNDEFQVFIQDDLTGLDMINVTIIGHKRD